ncbi:phage portal protein [Streptosporangium sp. NPDC002524]|uniref:phage portal protein n=1 Tax=Streptosporangium sp. NPDC002524 TaxID=3154537 RepID=UPI00332E4103
MPRSFLPGLLGRSAPPPMETKQYFRTDSAAALNGLSLAARRAWPVDRAVAEGLERTVWVYKCVDAIATHGSSLLYELLDDEEIVEGHPLPDLLNEGQANQLETGHEFRYRLVSQILLSPPGSFAEITYNNGGDPIRLDLLPPGRTRPVPGKDGVLLSHFETSAPDGTRNVVPAERVRWFRKPHPTDPYMGITPLQAAGLSVDLDFLSRLYNVSFIRNDARPSGVLGVEGKLSQPEADRIENRFARGPLEAGKLSVINGKLTFHDLAARPRDMAYGEMAARAKEEVLAAFGVGESVLGNSSGRTWDNAEQELFTFWTITMLPLLKMIAAVFNRDSPEGIKGRFNTDEVEVLRRPEALRRAEAREEFGAGLISPKEYRAMAGYEEVDLPHIRALYIAQGKTPTPTTEEDAIALGMGPPESAAPPAEDAGAVAGQPGEIPPADSAAQDPANTTGDVGDTAEAPATFDAADPATEQALATLQSAIDDEPDDEEEEEEEEPVRQTKALLPNPDPAVDADADERAQEDKLQAALTQLVRRLVERTAARAASPKVRKGTRHFQPEYSADTRVGDAPLDVTRIIDPQQWHKDAAAALSPLLVGAATAAAAEFAAALPHTPGLDVVAPAIIVARTTRMWLADQIAEAATRISDLIRSADQEGRDMTDIVAEIRLQLPGLETWGERTAVRTLTHLIHATQAAVAQLIAGPDGLVSATWGTRGDSSTRSTHRAADGQTRLAGDLFEIGEAHLRWPGDLDGPPIETYGCRCRVRWMISL